MANSNGNNTIADSGEISDLCCDLCSKTGINNADVDGFCLDCVHYFCAACLRFHQIFLPLHKQLDKHDMPKHVCTDLCTVHNDEVIKFYCKHCDEFICSKCKTENHEQCHEVQFLPLLVKDLENSKELPDFVRKLNQFETELDNTKASIDDNLTSIEVVRGETLDTLNKQKLKTQNNFIIDTEQLDRIIQILSDEDKLKSESDMTHVLFISNSLNVMKQELRNRQIDGQRCKLYTALIKTKRTMSKLEQELQDIQQHISMIKNKYKPKKYTVKIQDMGEVETDGELLKAGSKDPFSLRESFDNIPSKYKECMCTCMQLVLVVGMMVIAFGLGISVLRGSFELQIAVKIQTVELRWDISEISDFCILDDGCFVGINQAFRLIVKCEEMISGFTITMHKLWAVAKIEATKVAVTIPEEMSIQIHDIEVAYSPINISSIENQKGSPANEQSRWIPYGFKRSVYESRNIKLEGNPYGIDCIDEKLFVMVYSKATQQININVFNLGGWLLKTFPMELYWNRIQVSPFKMTLDTSKGYKVYLMYVFDASEQTVIGLKIHEDSYQIFYNHNIGKYPTFYSGFSWKIKEGSLGPTAMTIDMDGYVYFCCDEENNIYKISPDLKNAIVVLGTDKDMSKPKSMMFRFKKLYIASAQCNIRVFEMQKSKWVLY